MTDTLGTISPRVVDTSDKLRIINQALINTGNTPVNIGDDTSDEWVTASSAFDQWVEILLYRRNWNFATRLATLTRLGDSSWPVFNDVFARPADCMFLIDCYRPDIAALIKIPPSYWDWVRDSRAPELTYKLIGGQIHTNAIGGLVGIYIPFPVGSQDWSIGFEAVLRLKIEATLYRALNEDMTASAQAEKMSELALAEAAARSDQEEPRRVAFRSHLQEARRFRRGGW